MASYFNLAPNDPNAAWLPQYAAVALGVLVEPYLRDYVAKGQWDLTPEALAGRLVFALLMTLAILPGVYRRTIDPDRPVAIQIMALFPMGLGWRTVFDGLQKPTGIGDAVNNFIG